MTATRNKYKIKSSCLLKQMPLIIAQTVCVALNDTMINELERKLMEAVVV